MKSLKRVLIATAVVAGIAGLSLACGAGNVDTGVSCTEKIAQPLALECTVAGELTSGQFRQMLSSAQDSLNADFSVQKTADELEAMIATAGMNVEVVTRQLPKDSTMRGSYDDGFEIMGNGMVASGLNASNPPTITLYTGDMLQTFETLGGNGKVPMATAQKLAHERLHVLQASKALSGLAQFLNENGFSPVFMYNWGGSTNNFYLKSKNGSMQNLGRPGSGKTYAQQLAELEKSWTRLGNSEFIASFHQLLDAYANQGLDGKIKPGEDRRATALEALTVEADGLAMAFDAAHIIGEIQAYIAIPHSAIYRKPDIEQMLTGYVDTEIEKQLFPQVSSALDQIMRGYVALEESGITGTDAHAALASLVGGVMRPAQDYAQPFTFLKGDISALIQQLGVPEPTEAQISAGWEKLGERNRQVTYGEIGDALVGAATNTLGAEGRIAAAVGRKTLLGIILVNYCSNPAFSGTSLTDVKVTASEANGGYTTAISGTVECR